jgi:hypothetical protein
MLMRKVPLDNKNKPTRFYSNLQEAQVSKRIGGRRTPNSGATAFIKGDIQTKSFIIECKTCTEARESISIKKEWLDKLKKEMMANGKTNFALFFNFGGIYSDENYVIIKEKDFLILKEYMEETNG